MLDRARSVVCRRSTSLRRDVTWLRASGYLFFSDLTGTLGIAKLSGDITKQGDTTRDTLINIAYYIAVISAGVGLVNLFPLPILDGGHLVFYTIEAIKGSPLSLNKIELAHKVGMILLFSLMIFALFNDFRRMLGFM